MLRCVVSSFTKQAVCCIDEGTNLVIKSSSERFQVFFSTMQEPEKIKTTIFLQH